MFLIYSYLIVLWAFCRPTVICKNNYTSEWDWLNGATWTFLNGDISVTAAWVDHQNGTSINRNSSNFIANVQESKQTIIGKPGQWAQSKFWTGQESEERESWQAAGRCKVQRQKAGQVTGTDTRSRGQGQKAGQIPGDRSEQSAGE